MKRDLVARARTQYTNYMVKEPMGLMEFLAAKMPQASRTKLKLLLSKRVVYVDNVITQIVPPTLLVTYNGSGYSVPTKFINKRVKLVPIENKLYVYFNTELVTVHQINKNKFNYKHDHYQEALHHTICNKDIDIDAIAEENLKLLERIGK